MESESLFGMKVYNGDYTIVQRDSSRCDVVKNLITGKWVKINRNYMHPWRESWRPGTLADLPDVPKPEPYLENELLYSKTCSRTYIVDGVGVKPGWYAYSEIAIWTFCPLRIQLYQNNIRCVVPWSWMQAFDRFISLPRSIKRYCRDANGRVIADIANAAWHALKAGESPASAKRLASAHALLHKIEAATLEE